MTYGTNMFAMQQTTSRPCVVTSPPGTLTLHIYQAFPSLTRVPV